MMILGIVIGILILNVVCCIVALIPAGKDDDVVLVACGIVGLFLLLINSIVRFIKKIIKNKRFCSVLIDPEGKACYCKPLDFYSQSILFEKGYQWNENIANKYKPSDGWNLFICRDENSVNLRYTPVKIAKEESLYKIKNKELKKILDKLQ